MGADVMLDLIRHDRVLVVENEFVIAMVLEQALCEAGFEVEGPVFKLSEAMELASTARLDAALLDIELDDGVTIYPVADILARRRIPFAFVSARSRDQIRADHADRPLWPKPFAPDRVAKVIASLTGRNVLASPTTLCPVI
jgi:DNA-binding response OmpR family regulator